MEQFGHPHDYGGRFVHVFRRTTILAALTTLAGTTVVALTVAPAAAVACSSSDAQLSVVEAVVSQGLPHNGTLANSTNKRLTRGKTTVVRLHLSLPSTAPAGTKGQVQPEVSGTGLQVLAGGTVLTPAPLPVRQPTTAVTTTGFQANSPADPVFVVPGKVLAPATTTAAYDATFAASVRYTMTIPTATGTKVCVGQLTYSQVAPVERRTGALRVLFVPMGNGSATSLYSAEFSPAAQAAVQKSVLTVSRILPVPDGVADLAAPPPGTDVTSAGMRYHISQSLLDLSTFESTYQMKKNGKYCVRSDASVDNWTPIASALNARLTAWNSENQGADAALRQADRVIGVLDERISEGPTALLGSECFEGIANLNGPTGFVRARYRPELDPQFETGATAAMELLHSVGLVPATRDGTGYHSPNTYADTLNPDRGVNTVTTDVLTDPRTVMNFVRPFRDKDTLLEQPDWEAMLCVLDGPATSECGGTKATVGTTGTLGTTTAVGAASRLVAHGLTDGTAAGTAGGFGTDITQSYLSTEYAETPEDENGSKWVRLTDSAGGELFTRQIPESALVEHHDTSSGHDEGAAGQPCPAPHGDTNCRSFSISVPAPSTTHAFELWQGEPGIAGSTMLARRVRDHAPVVTSFGVVSDSDVTATRVSPDATDDTDPSLSRDGNLVAYTATSKTITGAGCSTIAVRDLGGGREVFLGNSPRDPLTGAPPCDPSLPGHAAFTRDTSRLAYTDGNGQLFISQFDRELFRFGITKRVYVCPSVNNLGAVCLTDSASSPTLLSDVSNPAFSPDTDWDGAGTTSYRLAFDAAGPGGRGTYIVDPDKPVLTMQTGTTVYAVTLVAGDRQDPAWHEAAGTDTRSLAVASTDGSGGIDRVDIARPVLDADSVRVFQSRPLACCGTEPDWSGRFLLARLTDGSGFGTVDTHQVDATSAPVLVPARHSTAGDAHPDASEPGNPFAAPTVLDRDSDGQRDVFLLRPDPSRDRRLIVLTAKDADGLADVTATALLNCGDLYDPVFAALRKNGQRGDEGVFTYPYDPSGFTCGTKQDGTPTTLRGYVVDQLQRSAPVESGPVLPPGDHAPVAAILAPDNAVRFPWSAVTLSGASYDAEDDALPDSGYSWQVRRPDGTTVEAGAGQTLTIPGSGQVGLHTVTLIATDSSGRSGRATAAFHTAVPTRTATVKFEPGTVGTPDTGDGTVTTKIEVDGDLSLIRAASVRIAAIDGRDVTSLTGYDFTAKSWSLSGNDSTQKAIAKFNKIDLERYLKDNGIFGRVVAVTVYGDTGGTPDSWAFAGADPSSPFAA